MNFVDLKSGIRCCLKLASLLLLGFASLNLLAQALPQQQQMRGKLAHMISQADQGADSKTGAAKADLPNADPARPRPLPVASSDPQTRRLYEKALQDYYIYRSEGLQHRRAVFRWQLFSARLIFFIVLALVASGIVFAAIQFRQGMNGNHPASGGNESTQLEISSKGVKVSSPVIGVIILTLSLAFFYLYLVYVYPIENIF